MIGHAENLFLKYVELNYSKVRTSYSKALFNMTLACDDEQIRTHNIVISNMTLDINYYISNNASLLCSQFSFLPL